MIDAQVHVFVKENLPDGNRMEFARRAARSRLPYRDPLDILPRVGRGTWDPGAEDLLQFMQDAKIDIAVNAVSEPEKKPHNKIKKKISNKIEIVYQSIFKI